ncbi:hypothetical protein ACFV9C_42425 [Kribbella sp. NPDC059898]|uniref:hypothetical protein n=1 Tax=Kribbella sp. NPDC059898 TaxID=3346995 RepID=UPI003667C16D
MPNITADHHIWECTVELKTAHPLSRPVQEILAVTSRALESIDTTTHRLQTRVFAPTAAAAAMKVEDHLSGTFTDLGPSFDYVVARLTTELRSTTSLTVAQ